MEPAKTATQATLDDIRAAYDKKVRAIKSGYKQDLQEHYEIIQVAQRTKDDADWMIRFHQTMADRIRLEQHDRLEELRIEYEQSVTEFINRGVIPAGLGAV